MANLSDRNNKIKIVDKPQSPQVAGMQVTLPPGAPIPSGWVELNGQTLVGAETDYPDLWLNAPAAWKSGSDLVLPYGEVESAWTDLSPYVDSTSGSPVISRLLGKARRDSGGQWYIDINGNGTKANSASEAIFNMATDSMKFQDQISAGSSYNADSNQAQVNGTPQRIRTGAYPSNFPAWVVSFSDVRASGKPDFVESVGTPCIKLYSDSTNAISVGVRDATATESGVVKANRTQRKVVTSLVDTNTTFLTFNNLTVGKLYNIFIRMGCRVSNTDTAVYAQAVHDGAVILSCEQALDVNGGSSTQLNGSVNFVATDTTVSIQSSSASPQAFIYNDSTPTGRSSFAVLTELNNTVETTAFT